MSTYPGEKDYLAATQGARRRRDVATAVWIASVIVAAIVVGILLEPTHGIVLLLLVLMGAYAWHRHETVKKKAAIRDRAAQASAEMSRIVMEAAARTRAARAAPTKQSPAAEQSPATERTGADESLTDPDGDHRVDTPEGSDAPGDPEEVVGSQRFRSDSDPFGDLDEMSQMSPTQFEHVMSLFLRLLGMVDVQRVGAGSGPWIDLMAHDLLGRTVMIRCVQRSSGDSIGLPEIQRFIDLLYLFRQDVSLFLTSSDFTPGARELARRHEVHLIKGSEIEELARRPPEAHD
jgi:restriction endonuclease Mrr